LTDNSEIPENLESKDLETAKTVNAGNLIRGIAKEIQGGGGGQSFFASAGGKDASGIAKAVAKAEGLLG
jgi:alanyl-tRNA synthetase